MLEALAELQVQTSALEEQVAIPLFQHLPTDWLTPVPMRFPIIHRYMAQLLRCFEQVDGSYALLLTATREGFIVRERQRQLFAPVIYVYGMFKAAAMQQKGQRVAEIANWD